MEKAGSDVLRLLEVKNQPNNPLDDALRQGDQLSQLADQLSGGGQAAKAESSPQRSSTTRGDPEKTGFLSFDRAVIGLQANLRAQREDLVQDPDKDSPSGTQSGRTAAETKKDESANATDLTAQTSAVVKPVETEPIQVNRDLDSHKNEETDAQREYLENIMGSLGFPKGAKLNEISVPRLKEMFEEWEEGKTFNTAAELAKPILEELKSGNISLNASGGLLFVIGEDVRREVIRGLSDAQKTQVEKLLKDQISDIGQNQGNYENPQLAQRSLSESLYWLQDSKLDERQRRGLGGLFARYKSDIDFNPADVRTVRIKFASRLFELGFSPDQLDSYFNQLEGKNQVREMFYRTIMERGDLYDLARARQNSQFSASENKRELDLIPKRQEIFQMIENYNNEDPKNRKLDEDAIAKRLYDSDVLPREMADILAAIGNERTERRVMQKFFGLVNVGDKEHPWVKTWTSHPDYETLSSRLPSSLRKLIYGQKPSPELKIPDELDIRLDPEYSEGVLREEARSGMPAPKSEDEKDDFGDWMNNEIIRKRRGFVTWVASLEALPKDEEGREKALIRSYQEHARLSLVKKPDLEQVTTKIIEEALNLHYSPEQLHWIIDKLGLIPDQSQKVNDRMYDRVVKVWADIADKRIPSISDNRFLRMWEDDEGFSNWRIAEVLSKGLVVNIDELKKDNATARAKVFVESYDRLASSLDHNGRSGEVLQNLWNEEIAKEALRAGMNRDQVFDLVKSVKDDEDREDIVEKFEEIDPSSKKKREERNKLLGQLEDTVKNIDPANFSMDGVQGLVDRASKIANLGGVRWRNEAELHSKIDKFIKSDPRIAAMMADFYSKKIEEFNQKQDSQQLLSLFDGTELLGLYENNSVPGLNDWIDSMSKEMADSKGDSHMLSSLAGNLADPHHTPNELLGSQIRKIFSRKKGGHGSGHH